jgi:hypothetical protein
LVTKVGVAERLGLARVDAVSTCARACWTRARDLDLGPEAQRRERSLREREFTHLGRGGRKNFARAAEFEIGWVVERKGGATVEQVGLAQRLRRRVDAARAEECNNDDGSDRHSSRDGVRVSSSVRRRSRRSGSIAVLRIDLSRRFSVVIARS